MKVGPAQPLPCSNAPISCWPPLLWGPLTLTAGTRLTATMAVTLGPDVPNCTWITNTAFLGYKAMKPLVATASHATWCYTYLPIAFWPKMAGR